MAYNKATTKKDDVLFELKRGFYFLRLDSLAEKVPSEKFHSYVVFGAELQE